MMRQWKLRKKFIPLWLKRMVPFNPRVLHFSLKGSLKESLSGRSTNLYPAIFTNISSLRVYLKAISSWCMTDTLAWRRHTDTYVWQLQFLERRSFSKPVVIFHIECLWEIIIFPIGLCLELSTVFYLALWRAVYARGNYPNGGNFLGVVCYYAVACSNNPEPFWYCQQLPKPPVRVYSKYEHHSFACFELS